MPSQYAHLRLENADGRVTVWLDVADRTVNVFTPGLMADLDAALDELAADRSSRVLVIRSAKPSGFLAGADLHEFTAIKSAQEASALSARGQQLFDKLERLPFPSLAVIHGPCLGGGLEFALACDYRLVVEHPKTQLGLPEIELGLLPGWGGTQRLPRVVGLEPALRMILGGRRLNAADARRWGLADVQATDAELPDRLTELAARAEKQGKRAKEHLPLRTWRQALVESNPVGRYLIFRGTERLLRQRVPDDMPAPWEALQAVRTGIQRGRAAGLAQEREGIGRLALTPACHNLVGLFFAREQAKKLPAELRADKVRRVRRIGVVGAGTMGAGIAQLAAIKGFVVTVQEVNEAALTAGMRKIEDLFSKAVDHRVLSADEARDRLAGIGRTTTWEGFGDVDLAVEAVIEDLDAKRTVFAELERRTRPDTILATNTSSLLVESIQGGRTGAERIGGLHFFNPVHKMPLIEVVRAPATDDATAATLTQWAIDLGKTPVVVKDSPGFLVNRILMPYFYEAVRFVTEEVAGEGLGEKDCSEDIDRVLRRFGMGMGPLELLDQVGLDVAAHIERCIQPSMGPRYEMIPTLQRMCARGWLGQKSGVGFYRYSGKKKRTNPDLRRELPDDVMSRYDFADFATEVRDRLVLPMVNEAAACLAEGLAPSPETIDLAMVFGTGWAPHRGGPLHYGEQRGIGEVVRRLNELARQYGPRFEPCAELRRRADRGEPFFAPLHAVAPSPV